MRFLIKELKGYLQSVVFVLFLTVMLAFSNQDNFKIFTKEEIFSLEKSKINPHSVYASSSRSIYKSQDNGRSWNEIYTLGNVNKRINRLYMHPESIDVFAATQDGLYESKNQGIDWQRVFTGSSDLENDCISIAKSTEATYLGTRAGLFIRYSQMEKWAKPFEQLSDGVVSAIVIDPQNEDIVYVASERGVFKTVEKGRALERIFVVYGSEVPEEDYSNFDSEVSDKVVTINDMVIPLQKANWLYIATIKGIFVSKNGGTRWQRVISVGLPSFSVRSLKVSDDGEQLFATTNRGVFQLSSGHWQRIGNGSRYNDGNDFLIDDEGYLWLAGKEGIYKMKIEEGYNNIMSSVETKDSGIDFDELFKGEPPIEAVQKAAIEYAEVNMNKIKSWRKQARMKALLPTVSVGYDKNVYGSSSGAMAVGPRSWDIDFSWDVADLIWNSDQTSIDSRSRLTVQLRQDILDQVTHLFYERQRLKTELLVSPPQNKREAFFKQLELQEITAHIDALTDGCFSHYTEDNKS